MLLSSFLLNKLIDFTFYITIANVELPFFLLFIVNEFRIDKLFIIIIILFIL